MLWNAGPGGTPALLLVPRPIERETPPTLSAKDSGPPLTEVESRGDIEEQQPGLHDVKRSVGGASALQARPLALRTIPAAGRFGLGRFLPLVNDTRTGDAF